MDTRAPQTLRRRRQAGTVMILVTVALIALLGFVALATDPGRVWAERGQVQAATDAAALAGAGEILKQNGTQVDEAGARTAATTFGEQHESSDVQLQFADADIEVGSFDLATRTFTPLPGSTDPSQVRAVRVVGRRDAALNGEVPTLFGQVLGVDSIPVTTEAIGYRGFVGTFPPGSVELPITIDCCAIAGSTCDQDFCATIQTPSNPCPLDPNDPDSKTVTCLEFFSTPEQNACWTEFDSGSPSVSTPGLQDIVRAGNTDTIGEDAVFVDNGTKTPTIQTIHDRFHGEGEFSGNPAGIDTDGDGTIDSWVTVFPVVECQNPGDQCAGGDSQEIVGAVCFDLQRVDVAPDKIIRGEFLCPTDPRFDRCDAGGTGPGGGDFGVTAQAPVLVR